MAYSILESRLLNIVERAVGRRRQLPELIPDIECPYIDAFTNSSRRFGSRVFTLDGLRVLLFALTKRVRAPSSKDVID
jgi:hypothetical protein